MNVTIAPERATPTREIRALDVRDLEMRDNADGSITLDGYASITDAPYEVSDFLGDYTETIARGAFGKTLQERADVRLLVNHAGVPLARTKSGTLTLTEDAHGLRSVATLDASNPTVQEVRSAMSRGDLDQMSFAFRATRQDWNADYSARTINELRLYDVSIVTYPANPATTVGLRSMLDESFDPKDPEQVQRAIAMLQGLLVDEATEEAVRVATHRPDVMATVLRRRIAL